MKQNRKKPCDNNSRATFSPKKDFDKLFMSPPSVTHERTRSLSQHGSYPRAAENQMPGKPSWEQKITRPPVPHCDMFQASTCSRLFKKLS